VNYILYSLIFVIISLFISVKNIILASLFLVNGLVLLYIGIYDWYYLKYKKDDNNNEPCHQRFFNIIIKSVKEVFK